MIIKAEKLSYNYGQLQALKDIDFQVKSGELLGVIGPNGSGKTTLVKKYNWCFKKVMARYILITKKYHYPL